MGGFGAYAFGVQLKRGRDRGTKASSEVPVGDIGLIRGSRVMNSVKGFLVQSHVLII